MSQTDLESGQINGCYRRLMPKGISIYIAGFLWLHFVEAREID